MPNKTPGYEIMHSFPIKIEEFKSVGEEWEVSGYVSKFNNLDLGRDVVIPGAFKKTLTSGPKSRFFREHDPRLLIGLPKRLTEDHDGLIGVFKISKTRLGEETHTLLEDGALDSFSFGYHADDYDYEPKEDVRHLKSVTLYESSLVAMAMNQEAVVTGFKDLFGITAGMTLAEQAEAYTEGMTKLTNDLREMVKVIDRPLSETKRQELERLLASCAGLDAVRSDLKSVLSAAPTHGLVSAKRTAYELADLRKRLQKAGILTQE